MSRIFGNILREARNKKSLSISGVSIASGVAEEIVDGFENGKHQDKIEYFKKIMDALGLSEMYLRYTSEDLYMQKFGRPFYQDDRIISKERFIRL